MGSMRGGSMRKRSVRAAVVGASLLLVVAVAIVITVVWAPLAPAPAAPTPDPGYALPVVAPAAAPSPLPGIQHLADPAWVKRTSVSTGIPVVAVAAYAGAALAKAAQLPSCGLGWTTLAGIGFAESRHGTANGSSLSAQGTAVPPIFGVPLDASLSPTASPDPNGGAAMGPMQLIPQTWRNWHTDANADGVQDPQNIFDATMATANYLCRASGEMAVRSGWRAGIAAYNSAPSYLVIVSVAANRYARDVG